MLASVRKRLSRITHRGRCPECGKPVRETYCDVCGYDLIRQTRDRALEGPGS